MIASAESRSEECCGFLFGDEDKGDRRLLRSLGATNVAVAERHRRFEISPLEYLNAEKIAEQHDLNLIGIYHSHPNSSAIPSLLDTQLAQPFFSYIIIATKDNKAEDIRSWRLNSKFEFEEEEIFNQTIQFNN